MSAFYIEIPESLAVGIVDLADRMGVTNVKDLVVAIIEEKLSKAIGFSRDAQDGDSVSLTHGDNPDGLVKELREASSSQDNEVFSSLGPSVLEAPDRQLTPEEKSAIEEVNEITNPSIPENNERLERLESMMGQLLERISGGDSPF